MIGFTLENALQVAEKDINSGICFAIDLLEELGFNVSSYYEELNKSSEENFDSDNIMARNHLFEKLGITELMEVAYSVVCGERFLFEIYTSTSDNHSNCSCIVVANNEPTIKQANETLKKNNHLMKGHKVKFVMNDTFSTDIHIVYDFDNNMKMIEQKRKYLYEVSAWCENDSELVDLINGKSYVFIFDTLKKAREYMIYMVNDFKQNWKELIDKENKLGNKVYFEICQFQVPTYFDIEKDFVSDYEYISVDSRKIC